MHPTLNHNHNLSMFNFSTLHLIYTVSTKQTKEWYNKSFGQGSRIIYDSLTYYVECLWTKFWASLILPEKNNRLLLNIYIINNMSLDNSFVQRQICNYCFKNCNISNRLLLKIHIIDNMSSDNSFAQQQICSYHFKNGSI